MYVVLGCNELTGIYHLPLSGSVVTELMSWKVSHHLEFLMRDSYALSIETWNEGLIE